MILFYLVYFQHLRSLIICFQMCNTMSIHVLRLLPFTIIFFTLKMCVYTVHVCHSVYKAIQIKMFDLPFSIDQDLSCLNRLIKCILQQLTSTNVKTLFQLWILLSSFPTSTTVWIVSVVSKMLLYVMLCCNIHVKHYKHKILYTTEIIEPPKSVGNELKNKRF